MAIPVTVSPVPATHSLRPEGSGSDNLRSNYVRIVLAGLALLAALATAFNVLHNPRHTDVVIYGMVSLAYLVAALSQGTLLPQTGTAALHIRWQMWVAFLFLKACGFGLAFLDDGSFLHTSDNLRFVSFSLGYALAFTVTVNPPRSTAWRRLWLVDALLAAVVFSLFILVFHYGEVRGVYSYLLFSIAIQIIFFLGSFLALYAAESREAQSLAVYMLAYFALNSLIYPLANLPHIFTRLSFGSAGDALFALAPFGLALAPVLLHSRLQRQGSATLLHARPLPPAAPVLITCAILLACLPLLHFKIVAGLAFLVVAISLFALKVALLQKDFDHERTSLLQSNKQLRELAFIDPVTGIANRRSFMASAQNSLQTARSGLCPYWLLLFEVEGVRRVFASNGRRASELYLCDFVNILRDAADPSTSHVSHIADGEFALLLERANQQTAEAVMQHVLDRADAAHMRIHTGAALAASSGPDTVDRWLANAATNLHRNRAYEKNLSVTL